MPSLSETSSRWFQSAEQGLADRMARRQLTAISARADRPLRPTLASRLGMGVLVAPVHLILVASFIGGVYLMVLGPTGPERVAGVVLVLVCFATFPRPSRVPRHCAQLRPEDAPLLFGLLDDVGAVCGARRPHAVLLTDDFNAFAVRVGWRRTPMLGLGAPLWVAASPQARVGLVGHELGHFAHGDLTASWWVWAAERSLLHWADILKPPRVVYDGRRWGRNFPLMKYLLIPFQAIVEGYLWLIRLVNGPFSQRREFLADVDAANAAGTPGAVRALEILLTRAAVETAMTRAAVSPSRPDIWATVRADVDGWSDGDFARRRASTEAQRNRLDATHPTTLLRIELLESLPSRSARVVLDTGRSHAIDAEIARPLAAAAKQAAEHIRYQR